MAVTGVTPEVMEQLLAKAAEFLRTMEPRSEERQVDALLWIWRLLPNNGWRVTWMLCRRALWRVYRNEEPVKGMRRHGAHEPYSLMKRQPLPYNMAGREVNPARQVELQEGCQLVEQRAIRLTEQACVVGIPLGETHLEIARRTNVTPSGIRQALRLFKVRMRKELPSLRGY